MSDIQVIDINSVTPHPSNPRRGNVAAIKKSLTQFGQVTPIVVQASTGFVVKGNHTRMAAIQLGWTQIQAIVMEMDDATARDYLLVDNRTSDVAKYDEASLIALLASVPDLEELGFSAEDMLRDNHDPLVDAPLSTVAVEHTIQMDSHEAERFGTMIQDLQKQYGTRTLSDTIQQAVAVAEAAAKEQAGVAAPLEKKGLDESTDEDEEALQDWWDWRAAWEGLPEYVNESKKAWKQILVHFASPEDMEAFSQLVGQALTEKTRYIWYPEVPIFEVMGKLRYVEVGA
jgi:ParB-like chromosome segregation protein Spo0J